MYRLAEPTLLPGFRNREGGTLTSLRRCHKNQGKASTDAACGGADFDGPRPLALGSGGLLPTGGRSSVLSPAARQGPERGVGPLAMVAPVRAGDASPTRSPTACDR
jgi:hypothetical protein